ncbi:universal stress protein [Piscinibacter sakaiensis]|uniref:universal stress protein n=1 Tax=Piscinibacter sakaiensis TaxID=1547922 RepID=UPI003AAF7C66
MYRHLLVPIDDSDLSIDVIGNAIGLARAVAARITFFHVADDPARHLGSDAEVLRLTAHDEYCASCGGKGRELLAKAEAAARAWGVPCSSLLRSGEKPATAIIEAARSTGCDLIFMASHGHRGRLGMALASETLLVLMNAGLPVLVSATGDPKPRAHAIGIIRDEHRSLAAVMHGWMQMLATARRAGKGADAARMRAIVRHLRDFPSTRHHPKEDDFLFARLRARTDAFDAELDELQRQHQRDDELIAELAASVERLAECADAAAAVEATCLLDEAVQDYARFLWDHLGREEGVILPAAQQHLSDSDWNEIDRAFRADRHSAEAGDIDKARRQLFASVLDSTPSSS